VKIYRHQRHDPGSVSISSLVLFVALLVSSRVHAGTPSPEIDACPALLAVIDGSAKSARGPLRDREYASAFLRLLEDKARSFRTPALFSLGRDRGDDAVSSRMIDAVLTYVARSAAVDCEIDSDTISIDRAPRERFRLDASGAMAYLEILTGRLRVYRIRAPEHLRRAGFDKIDQDTVDAVLVHFVNFVAVSFGVEYTLYAYALTGA
jgi:hypothetical protein